MTTETKDFYSGVRGVSDEIQAGVSEVLAKESDRVEMQWSPREVIAAGAVPDSIELDASTSQGKVRVIFSREQLEDSATRIDRPDVRALIRQIVAQLVGK